MSQFAEFKDSVLGRDEEQKKKEQQREQKKKEERKKAKEPECSGKIKTAPIEIGGSDKQNSAPAWRQTSVEMVEDIVMSMPNASEVVSELNEKLSRATKKKFHRVYVDRNDPEGDYTTDEVEAFESWGSDYRSVFRLAEHDDDDELRPLGRIATAEETKELLMAEKKAKEKKKK